MKHIVMRAGTAIKSFLPAVLLLSGILTASAEEFPLRTDMPPVGRTGVGDYVESGIVYGTGSVKRSILLGFDDLDTGILELRSTILSTGGSFDPYSLMNGEEVYLFLDGPVLFRLGDEEAVLKPGSLLICPESVPRSFKNISESEVRLLKITVLNERGKPEYIKVSVGNQARRAGSFSDVYYTRLDRAAMSESNGSHQGHGPILFRRLFNTEAFATNIHVMSHAIVPPGSSIGLHQHNTREEVYFAVSGNGTLTANGHTIEFREGDAVPCRIHGTHGVFNDTDGDLELFVFSVAQIKGNVTNEINLGDDLTKK